MSWCSKYLSVLLMCEQETNRQISAASAVMWMLNQSVGVERAECKSETVDLSVKIDSFTFTLLLCFDVRSYPHVLPRAVGND